MKLVLASQGFMNDSIAKSVSELVGKPLNDINIVIINEGYVPLPAKADKRWMIDELSLISKYIGGIIDFINLRAYNKEEIKKRLNQADMMYIVGGKQFILPNLFKETGFEDILKEFAQTKVIMGTSAGSNVLGRQIESDEYWLKRYDKRYKDIENKCLGLVNFNIIPHYLRGNRKQWDKEFYSSALKDNPFLVYAINDEQAIIYDNGKIRFIGGTPVIFGNDI